METALWTLDDLGARVALALAVDYDGQANGRVREVPDRRTLRYYTTLGLLDRPAEMRGRTAYYGSKHLWQLLAIKRLQARGQTLVQIQQALLGLNDEDLRRLAGVQDEPAPKRKERTRDRETFWRTAPAPVEAPLEEKSVLQGVRLAPGVVLMLEALRVMTEED